MFISCHGNKRFFQILICYGIYYYVSVSISLLCIRAWCDCLHIKGSRVLCIFCLNIKLIYTFFIVKYKCYLKITYQQCCFINFWKTLIRKNWMLSQIIKIGMDYYWNFSWTNLYKEGFHCITNLLVYVIMLKDTFRGIILDYICQCIMTIIRIIVICFTSGFAPL